MKNIRTSNLSFSYTSAKNGHLDVLDDISLEIDAGDFVVVLGESGCGKTTLLNLLAGFLTPTGGAVYVNDARITEPHFSRSLIFQKPLLLPWLSVKDNIAFGCRIRGDTAQLPERVEKYITMFGLKGFELSSPDSLSLGMAQRVAIARSLIGKPEVLLLDEPFTALDFNTRSHLQDELVKLWKQLNFTAIFVTHSIAEALKVGLKIVILSSRPARVVHFIDLKSDIPRDLNKEEIAALKLDIQERFESMNNKPWEKKDGQ